MRDRLPLHKEFTTHSHLSGIVRGFLLLFEIVALSVLFMLTWKYFYNDEMPVRIFRRGYYILAFFYGIFLIICFKALRGGLLGESRVFDMAVSQSIGLVLCNVVVYFPMSLLSYKLLVPGWLLMMTLVQAACVVGWCFSANRLFFRLFRPLDMLLLTDKGGAPALEDKLIRYRERYRISGRMTSDMDKAEILWALRESLAVLLCSEDQTFRDWITIECFKRNKLIFVVPNVRDVIINSAARLNILDTPIFCTDAHRISNSDLAVKRCLDILCSFAGLVITLPLTLVCAAAVWLGDGGPVFFRQERLTRGEKHFRLIKFRTMVVDAEKDGQRLASEDDARITKVGRILRKTRMDELPQLLNILIGDMSLVGPRPECPSLAAEYEKTLPEFAYRLKVKAGLTGMAQVYGNYTTSPHDKLMMDIMYIEQFSLSLDANLVLLTLRALMLADKTKGTSPVPEEQAENGSIETQE